MKDQFHRQLEIFDAAAKLPAGEARERYLHQACGSDHSLLQSIRALLKSHDEAGTFLHDPAAGVRTLLDQASAQGSESPFSPVAERPGDRIGRYKLLQQIGEGGMGVVYMAEQEEPVRRRVALKVIKLGMDTRQVVARFEAERQALAMMDHPNIAKVLDAGATDSGRPFFVMELVRGIPITEYCDKNHLNARQRLELFLPVCHAIQHAHQKGVIHRDIKPSNVLVTLHDGKPLPMVIDFGVAKATNQKLTEKTLFTNFAAMIGTPAYMSPEQAEMSKLDVDTRSDIYSLGVLLYELLTGTTPFPDQRLRSVGYGEMQRIIIEEEPERPSTRLSTLEAEERTAVAKNRGVELNSLKILFRGDLDWVVMKCLEKDRTRRYETATGLAADLQRHLNNEIVIARPPSTAYRFQKAVLRNKAAYAAGIVVAVVLLAASLFSTSAFVRERTARIAAAKSEKAREETRKKAEGETVRADTAARFITSFLETAIPELYQKGHTKSIKQLVGTADRLASTLSNSFLAEAKLRFIVASAYDSPLFESTHASREFDIVRKLAHAAGAEGRRLAELARVRSLGNKLWNFAEEPQVSEEVVRELIRSGQEALAAIPADLEKLALTFGVVAEYKSYFGTPAEAEVFATANVRALDENPQAEATAWALYYPRLLLVNITASLGKASETIANADRLFDVFSSGRMGTKERSRYEFMDFLHTVWIYDSTRLPQASLEKLIQKIPPEDQELRSLVQGRLGIAMARSGNWTNGLAMLREANAEARGSAEFWNAQVSLEFLQGNAETIKSLLIDGLARFAGGSDFEHARLLIEPLLMLSVGPEYNSAIANLLTRTEQAPPWAGNLRLRPLALFKYRSGNYEEAFAALERLLNERRASAPSRRSWAEFLISAVRARQGRIDEAREAYEEGARLHSPALVTSGIPYEGNEWATAISAEIIRREAARLIGIEKSSLK